MRLIAKAIKSVLLLAVALAVVWSFFDVGRRFVQHRRDLAARPIELTVMHWGNPDEEQIVEDLVRQYEKDHPDTRVVRINAGGDFRNKLKTLMAADIAPDVFYLPPDILPELAETKQIATLDDRFAKEPAALRDDYFPILIDAFRYDTKLGVRGQGALYALPKDSTTTVFYVNCDLFEKAGLDWRAIQKNGWTWDEFEADMKKVTALGERPEFSGRTIYGTFFQLWAETFQTLLWGNDADYFARTADGLPDFTKTALDTPGAQETIDLVRRMRLVDKTAFNSTGIAIEGGKEFLNGNIGCTGPVGCWMIPTYKGIDKFKWDTLPMPRGSRPSTGLFYTGWTMSNHSKHPDQSYDLIRFLCGREGQVQQGRQNLAIPALKSVAYSADFLTPPDQPKIDRQLFLDAMDVAKLSQFPKQTQFLTIAERDANLAITAGRLTGPEVARQLQADWSHELNSPLRKRDWPTMPWRPILLGFAGVAFVVLLVAFLKVRGEKLGPVDRATERSGFAFIAPWVVGFLVFTLGPMIVSLLLAVSEWTGMTPIGEAKFVGTTNFKQLFTYDQTFIQSLKVTAYFVALGVPVSQLAALAIALLMNQKVRGIAIFRTIYFVPSVVSGAALAVLWLLLFNDKYGIINKVLYQIMHPVGRNAMIAGVLLAVVGGLLLAFGRAKRTSRAALVLSVVLLAAGGVSLWQKVAGPNPPNWFGYDQSTTPATLDAARWAVPAFVLMGLWGVGGGMIIYLAGLKGISQSLYEAARIDGAGKLRQTWNITVPMLSPLIFYNLVMGIIGSFQIFTQAYIMTDPNQNENSTLFYVLNLYRQAFEFHAMGYASAMAWVLFLLVLVLTLFVFAGSKKLVYYEGLR